MGSLGGSKSTSTSTSKQPQYAIDLGKALGSGFQKFFMQQGGVQNALSQPAGMIGSIYNNLFNPNAGPGQDYLGARGALERSLSGAGFGDAYNSAFEKLLPSARAAIDELNRNVLSASSPMGLRFSSDVMNQQRRGAQDILLGTQGQAVQTAMPFAQMQQQGALSIFDLIASLAQDQMARQVPLAVSLATGAPQISTSTRKDSSFDIGVNGAVKGLR